MRSFFAMWPWAARFTGRACIHKSLITLVSVISLASGPAISRAASVVIDDFTTAQSVTVTPSTTMADSSIAAAEAIGGERDLKSIFTSGFTSMTVTTNPSGSGLLINDAGTGVKGTAEVVWDGADGDATVIDTNGLAGVDLLTGGLDSFLLGDVLSDLPGSVVMTVYDASDATGDTWSRATLAVPGGVFVPTDFLIPYASFTTLGPNGAANFGDVGAISLLIDNTGSGSWDLAIGRVEAVPEPSTVALAILGVISLAIGIGRRRLGG